MNEEHTQVQEVCPGCTSPRTREKQGETAKRGDPADYFCLKCGAHFDTPKRLHYPLPVDIDTGSICNAIGRNHAETVLLAADSPITFRDVIDDYGVPEGSAHRILMALSNAGALADAGSYRAEDGGRLQKHFVRPDSTLVLDFSGEELTAAWTETEVVGP